MNLLRRILENTGIPIKFKVWIVSTVFTVLFIIPILFLTLLGPIFYKKIKRNFDVWLIGLNEENLTEGCNKVFFEKYGEENLEVLKTIVTTWGIGIEYKVTGSINSVWCNNDGKSVRIIEN